MPSYRVLIATTALATVLAVGADAAPALAATAGVTDAAPPAAPRLEYRAGAGEANAVTVLREGNEVVIEDSGALIEAGPGCSSLDPHRVRCSLVRRFSGDPGDPDGPLFLETLPIFVMAEDLDDTVSVSSVASVVAAGSGDDVVTGGSGMDDADAGSMDGGPGNDLLTGGPGGETLAGDLGDDLINGGAGGDTINGGGGGDILNGDGDNDTLTDGDGAGRIDGDSLNGGVGRDRISYDTRTRAIRVDLADAQAPQGERAEQDRISDFDDAAGGRGDDILLGTDGANLLEGNGGDDQLHGRGGPDELYGLDQLGPVDRADGRDRLTGGPGADNLTGGPGGDNLDGGAGDDVLDPSFDRRSAPRERVRCGAGRDLVGDDERSDPPRTGPDPRDFLDRDCERILTHGDDAVAYPAVPRRRRGGLELAGPCRAYNAYLRSVVLEATRRCRGSLTVLTSDQRTVLGHARFGLRDRTTQIALTSAARRLLGRSRHVTVALKMRGNRENLLFTARYTIATR